LIEQNSSLKEQLLLSQNHGSRTLKELNETKEKLKAMSKKLENYERKLVVINTAAQKNAID
jgi:hypothetical protein